MATAKKETETSRFVFTKEQIDDLTKKNFGLSPKDLEEIYAFIDRFNDVLANIDANSTSEQLAEVVNVCNKIPAHCGYIVINYFINQYGEKKFCEILEAFYKAYKSLFAEDPESTKTTDIYETMACFIQFSTPKALRDFIVKNFDISKDVYAIMRKRPSTNAAMSARYSELYLTSKFDKKYSDLIYENFNQMLEFLKTKNREISGVSDAVKINFNQLRDLMVDFYDNSKKESLKLVNKLINKKADIGEAFFYWIMLNPSCALEVITKEEKMTGEFITNFLCQMKIQYIVELAVVMQYIPKEKQGYLEYLKNTYKIENIDGFYERLSNLLKKDGIATYGPLLRQVSFFPMVTISKDESFLKVATELQQKLSAVANNLTAEISEKSMSITIVPLGRSRTYQDIMDKIEGIGADGEETNSFVAKMRDKDVVKKIRESATSWYSTDQIIGTNMIITLQVVQDLYAKGQSVEANEMEFMKAVYRELVLKFGYIQTFDYFRFIFYGLLMKKTNAEDTDDDYEDISAS